MTAVVRLKKGHVQPIWAGHPWVYAQAIASASGEPSAGDEVLVLDVQGKALARGLYSPRSAIAVRLFAPPEHHIDEALFRRRLERAVRVREHLGLPSAATTGFRLVHGEGDGLPGLIVDRFGDRLVVQFGSIGLFQRQDAIRSCLAEVCNPVSIVDRTSRNVARAEGFTVPEEAAEGDVPPLRFVELDLSYELPPSLGQKTGYYFDQRPLRQRIGALSEGRRVLDAHAYVGSSALCAARGGATEVLAVDTSARAIDVGRSLAEKNGLAARIQYLRADANDVLDEAADKPYGMVICDPPKFAKARGERQGGMRAMRRLVAKAVRATAVDGLVVVSSCSAAIGVSELTRLCSLAAADVGRRLSVVERHFQGPDHPVPCAFPEGLYLSTLITRVQALSD